MQKYSCAPACLRMVLESFGILHPEAYLRELCNCDGEGTSEYDLLEAAVALGFTKSYTARSTLTALRKELARGLYPIAFIKVRYDLSPNQQYFVKHAVVVVDIVGDDTNPEVFVLDPLGPAHPIPQPAFSEAWAMTENRLIVIDGASKGDGLDEDS
jgi:ABC-type bacteriocin/lantibiotic exporter with double-glycine peptidase domain